MLVKIRKKFPLIILFSFFTVLEVSAQCISPSFSLGSAACSGSPIDFVNSTIGSNDFEWDFCTKDFETPQIDTTLINTQSLFNYAAGAAWISDSGLFHAFICNRNGGSLIRMDFQNGIDSAPTSVTDLGNVFNTTPSPSDISFIKEGGFWYAIVPNLLNSSIALVSFSNGLNSAPTGAQTIIPPGTVSNPRGLKCIIDFTGNYHFFVTDFANFNVLHFTFGASLSNSPTLIGTYTIPGGEPSIDLDIISQCDQWYLSAVTYPSGQITLVKLGQDLNNVNPQFSSPIPSASYTYSVKMIRNADEYYLLVSNNAGLTLIKTGKDLSAPVPISLAFFQFGTTVSGLDLISVDSEWFGILSQEVTNVISKIKFVDPCTAGVPISTDSIPFGVSYGDPGTYPISLTATTSSGISISSLDSIIVQSAPVISFDWNGTCFGDTTHFLNSSTISNGSLISFDWDFGDGSTASIQSPSHLYSGTGAFSVSLAIGSSTGCSSELDTTVVIAPLPVASFSIGNSCSETIVPINNTTTISTGTISSWYWEFGNGDTISVSDPIYEYPSGGNFQITLIATSAAGCSDTSTNPIQIQDRPIGSLDVSNTCVGQSVQFNDQSSITNGTITGRTWYFGDGDTSTITNPVHTYNGGAANYAIQLIVTASNGCIDTVDFDLRISEQPISAFSFSPSNICSGMNVSFTDLSTVSADTLSRWNWDFGDGSSDTLANPVHTYLQAGNYTVELVAYSGTSCPGVLASQAVNVLQGPTPFFTAQDACDGSPVYFIDQSIPPPGSTITNYFWTMGDGQTSIAQNPFILYPDPGAYEVIQTITTDLGCIASDTQMVRVRELPSAQFATALPCNGAPVSFLNTSTTDSLSVLLFADWNFGDPASGPNNISSAFNPSHVFSGLTTYDVTLIVENNFGCRDTVTNELTILPSSPAVFTYSPTCYGDLMEFFNPGSPLDSAYLWDFGDNQFNQLQEPAHFYAFPGNYSVRLKVISLSGCVTEAVRTVTVSPIPVASFQSTPACFGTPYPFINNSNISSGSIVGYSWSVNGSVFSSTAQPSFLFPDTGNYQIRLEVTSDIGCRDSYDGLIRNNPLPIASFSFSPQFGNPPLEVNFTDLSTGAATYEWDFGDGSPAGSGASPIHTYQDTGYFFIREIVTSPFGCKDTLIKNIYVIRPVLDIAVLQDSSYRDGDNFYVVATIANLGTRPIDSLVMEARLDQGSTIRERYIQPIPNGPDGLQVYYFKAAFYLPDPDAPRFYCIRADAPNGEQDDVPENNERCFNRTPDLQLNIFPNPFTDWLTIDLILPVNEQVEVGLYDLLGRLIQPFFSGDAGPGLLRFRESYPALGAGTYVLRVNYRGRIDNKLVIKR